MLLFQIYPSLFFLIFTVNCSFVNSVGLIGQCNQTLLFSIAVRSPGKKNKLIGGFILLTALTLKINRFQCNFWLFLYLEELTLQ